MQAFRYRSYNKKECEIEKHNSNYKNECANNC